MRKYLWLALAALLVVAVIAGCPRKKDDGGDTNVSIRDNTPPAADSATPDNAAATPDINVDVDVTSPDVTATAEGGEGGEAAGEAKSGDAATPGDAAPGDKPAVDSKATAVSTVVLETTKGNIEVTVHPDWSPIGAAHFLELVNAKFYDGAPWFRVLDGFVAQCGVSSDPAKNVVWGEKTIQDEPVLKGNLPGTVAFGKSGMPNSRSTHIFINLVDNSSALDPQGFSAFGEVTSGMDIAQGLERCEYGDQDGLGKAGGLDAFKAMFPKADYIKRAYVK